MSIIKIKPAGEAVQKVTKLAKEIIHYTLDCKDMLQPNELVVTGSVIDLSEDISITEVRTWNGNGLTFKLVSTELDTSQYQDYLIVFSYITTMNNTRIAQFSLRIYK